PHYSFFLPLHPPPPSTLFPYTTLFRSLHTLDLGGGAIEIRLIRTRIDHVKEVAFFDDSASLEVNLSNITGYARPDLNRLDRFERSEEHTSELQSLAYLVCRLLLEKKKK